MDSEVCQTVEGANSCPCRMQENPTQLRVIRYNSMCKCKVGRYIDIHCLSSEIILRNFASITDIMIQRSVTYIGRLIFFHTFFCEKLKNSSV